MRGSGNSSKLIIGDPGPSRIRRFYFFADGDGGSYRGPGFSEREKEVLLRYRKNIVPMFKTTNGDMALHSYGAVQGLMAAGYAENCGVWVDEWLWPRCGFGKLGESIPQDKIWETRPKQRLSKRFRPGLTRLLICIDGSD